MYNMLFGVNKDYSIFLEMLGLKKEDCGRFRDCYMQDNKIIIYTRNGGGNREEYQEVIDKLATHKNYFTDYDDDFDCTYCYIEFSIPDEFKEDCKNMESENFIPSERFKILIDNLNRQNEMIKVQNNENSICNKSI